MYPLENSYKFFLFKKLLLLLGYVVGFQGGLTEHSQNDHVIKFTKENGGMSHQLCQLLTVLLGGQF